MNHNQLKSIISALSGAAIVLAAAVLWLTFFHDSPKNADPLATKPDENVIELTANDLKEETSTSIKPAAGEELSNKEQTIESFGILEKEEELAEVVQDEKEQEPVEETTKFKPLTENDVKDILSLLDNSIKEQQSIFVDKDDRVIPSQKEESPEEPPQRIVRKSRQVDSEKGLIPVMQDGTTVVLKTVMEVFFDEGVEIFNISPETFQKKWMRATNTVKTDALFSSARTASQLRFGTIVSHETIFSFRKRNLHKVSMMLFNKGDQLEIQENDFNSMKTNAIDFISVLTGRKPAYKPNAGVARNHIYFWVFEGILFKLEYSASNDNGFSADYLRLVAVKDPGNPNVLNIDKVSSNILTESELASMVTRNKNGDVIINGIPMVDQGQKGYCACAALARLLNYFGRDIDQHDIAKMSAATYLGTDPAELKKAIENMSAKLRLNMKVLAKPYLSSERDAKRLENKLNSILQKNPRATGLQDIYKAYAFEDRRYKEFEKNIINSIDRGRPVSWALKLGIIPEEGIPQAVGGHMRIITGYNKLEKKIYYSDTWGAGHEKKSMDMASAFYISLAVWEISPR